MIKWKSYNSLIIAAIVLFAFSFFYEGEEISIFTNERNRNVSFAMLYRMAASVMSLLWIGYLIFNERLYSEKMTNVHVRCSLICALLFISYPMWMNGIHAGIAADMLATGFVVSQCFFLINLVRGWQYAKTGPEDEGLTK